MSKCKVCGREIEIQCPYCSFREIIALDDFGEKRNEQRAQEYKKSLISKITNISINAEVYDDITYAHKGTNKVVIAGGNQCYLKSIKAKETFQGIDDESICSKLQQVSLNYQYDGKDKQVSFEMKMPRTNDELTFSITLEDNLTLSARAGNESVYTEAYDIPLDLK